MPGIMHVAPGGIHIWHMPTLIDILSIVQSVEGSCVCLVAIGQVKEKFNGCFACLLQWSHPCVRTPNEERSIAPGMYDVLCAYAYVCSLVPVNFGT